MVKILYRVSVDMNLRGRGGSWIVQGEEDEGLVRFFEGAAGSGRSVGATIVPVVVLCREDEGR